MKYKVGDKVKIREDLITNKEYGDDVFADDMEGYKGRIAYITDTCCESYELDVDNGSWPWTDEMLESVNKNVSDGHIQYILDRDKTIVTQYYTDEDGHKKYRKGIAKRNPIDPYNRGIGLIMAIADAYGIDKNTIHIGECECNNKNINNFIDKFINDKVAVHCETREESDNFLNFICKYSDKFTHMIPIRHYYVYNKFKNNTCYFYEGEKVYYDTKSNCINGKYGIIKYKDLKRFYKEI
ncbi:hypothetical protein ACFHWD_03075 [Clostridium sp. MT-14]|uniref:hypothetical protein n=1 Tax=Clostridium sp. MT-14 TaxID=3348360 RepID=UPI0035F42367